MFKFYSKLSSECLSVTRGEQLVSVVYNLLGVTFSSYHSVHPKVMEILSVIGFLKGQACRCVVVPINYHSDAIVFNTCNRVLRFR